MHLDEADLELSGPPWSEGGSAEIFDCRWRGRPYVYKRYWPDSTITVDPDGLVRMIAWRDSLPPVTADRLDLICAWPKAVVRRERAVAGILMDRAPAVFFVTGAGRTRARTLERIALLDKDIEEADVNAAAAEALAALGHTARVYLWLHRLGIVVNDVQLENVLVDDTGERVYLVDCDSMMSPGWGSAAIAAGPAYMNRVVDAAPSQVADLAKLSWLVFLVLLKGATKFSGPGPQAQEALRQFLPSATVRALTHAVTEGDRGEYADAFWAEQAASWVRRRRHGMLITDHGWLPVGPDDFDGHPDFGWLDEIPDAGSPDQLPGRRGKVLLALAVVVLVSLVVLYVLTALA